MTKFYLFFSCLILILFVSLSCHQFQSAAKTETGITDISQINEKKWPVRILTAEVQDMPTMDVPMRGPGIRANDPRMRTVPRFYYDATRDGAGGTIYLKVVNTTDAPLPVHVKITGVSNIEPTGQIGEVKGIDPLELNTITEREKIIPIMSKVDGLGTDFTRTFSPYSASVLIMNSKK